MQRLRIPLRGDGHHRASLRFPNGSRIVGLPGKEDTIRGYSEVSLLIIDEAARVTDEMYKALRPMLTGVRRRSIGPASRCLPPSVPELSRSASS